MKKMSSIALLAMVFFVAGCQKKEVHKPKKKAHSKNMKMKANKVKPPVPSAKRKKREDVKIQGWDKNLKAPGGKRQTDAT